MSFGSKSRISRNMDLNNLYIYLIKVSLFEIQLNLPSSISFSIIPNTHARIYKKKILKINDKLVLELNLKFI